MLYQLSYASLGKPIQDSSTASELQAVPSPLTTEGLWKTTGPVDDLKPPIPRPFNRFSAAPGNSSVLVPARAALQELPRIHRGAVNVHFKVQVGAGGAPAVTHVTNHFSPLHPPAGLRAVPG